MTLCGGNPSFGSTFVDRETEMHTLYLTNRKTCSLSYNSIVVIDFIQSLVITVVSVQIHQTLLCLSSPTSPLSGSQTLRLHSCVSPLPPLAASGSPSHSLRSPVHWLLRLDLPLYNVNSTSLSPGPPGLVPCPEGPVQSLDSVGARLMLIEEVSKSELIQSKLSFPPLQIPP